MELSLITFPSLIPGYKKKLAKLICATVAIKEISIEDLDIEEEGENNIPDFR